MKLVLINSSNAENIKNISRCLAANFIVESELSETSFLSHFKQKNYDYLFIDLSYLQKELTKKRHAEVLRTFWQIFPETNIILLTTSQSIRDAVEFVKAGASDFLSLPLVENDIRFVIRQSEEKLRLVSELNYLRESVGTEGFNYLLKHNPPTCKNY